MITSTGWRIEQSLKVLMENLLLRIARIEEICESPQSDYTACFQTYRSRSGPHRSVTQWRGRPCLRVASPIAYYLSKDFGGLYERLWGKCQFSTYRHVSISG
jgi:hypothetical protein